jgi:ribosomal protein S18 acetylase RimI-like enzyme
MLIRVPEENDLVEVLLLSRQSCSSDWGETIYRAELNNLDSGLSVAVDNDNKILGFSVVRLITAKRFAELLNIAVQPEQRRKKWNYIINRN